jgi:hypothetical protein
MLARPSIAVLGNQVHVVELTDLLSTKDRVIVWGDTVGYMQRFGQHCGLHTVACTSCRCLLSGHVFFQKQTKIQCISCC